MSKAVANLTQSTETITFSAQDNGETISVNITEAARGPNSVTIATASDGTANLSLNSLTFNNTPVAPATTPGSLSWNDQEGTLDLKLKGGNVTLQVGQENVIRIVNKTGGNLTQAGFKVVRVRKASEGGAQGQRLAVVLAQGDSEFDSTDVIGVVTEDILENEEGFVTTFGTVNGINTTGSLYGETWSDGELLFLSPTIPGGLTKVKPTAPNHLVIVGYVQYAHQNNGKLFVKTETSYELDELHNVSITDPATGEVLMYNGTTGLWENAEISTSITTSTPTNLTGYIYGDGTTVGGATAAATAMDADSLVLRDINGSSEFYSLSINPDTGSGFSSTIDAFNDGSLESNVTFTLPLASGTGAITGNVNGVVDIAHGGTNATTVSDARVNLSLGASGTITTSQPLSLTQTWSTTATYKAIDVNITDSGPANAASLLMDLRVGGVSKLTVDKSGSININGGVIQSTASGRLDLLSGTTQRLRTDGNGVLVSGYLSVGQAIGANEGRLFADAANTLAQRNGTNAQEFRLYGTYSTSPANTYERLTLKATGTAFQIGTEKGSGGGTARPLEFQTDGTTRMTIAATTGVVTATQFSAQVLQTTGNGFYAGETPIRLGVNNAMYFRALGSSDEVSLTTSAGGTNYRDLKLRNLTASGDAEITDSTKGVILKSPDGTRYRITVANGGTLTVTAV